MSDALKQIMAERDLSRAITALYLEVDESIVNDIRIKVDAAFQSVRDERDRLRGALQAFCDEVEMDAAVMAYKCDLGAGEWEAFIDRTKLYKQYRAGKAALTSAGGQERANDSHIG